LSPRSRATWSCCTSVILLIDATPFDSNQVLTEKSGRVNIINKNKFLNLTKKILKMGKTFDKIVSEIIKSMLN